MLRVFGNTKGYIEGYFLYLMSILCVMCVLQVNIINKACSVMVNIKKVQELYHDKYLVINWINNHIDNLENGLYEVNGIVFRVCIKEEVIEVNINGGDRILEIGYENNKLTHYY